MNVILSDYELELTTESDDLLYGFYCDRLQSGDTQELVEQYKLKVRLFAVDYCVYQYLTSIPKITITHIKDFAGLWYFQKVINSNENELISILDSLKLFFQYLYDQRLINNNTYQSFSSICSEYSYFIYQYRKWATGLDSNNYIKEPIKKYPYKQDKFYNDLQSLLPAFDETITFRQIIKHFDHFPDKLSAKVINLWPDDHYKQDNDTQYSSYSELEKHWFDLMRSNLIYKRWLERYNLKTEKIPLAMFAFCSNTEQWLETMFAKMADEKLNDDDIIQAHSILDKIDRTLWSARRGIAQHLNLDLRQLLIL